MTSARLLPHFEERFDLAFRERPERIRALALEAWRSFRPDAFSLSVDRSRQNKGQDNSALVIGGVAVFFVGQRLLLQTGDQKRPGPSALDLVASLVESLSGDKLTRFVFQSRSLNDVDPRAMRKQMDLLRGKLGQNLGPAVVSESTIFFHPGKISARARESSGYSIQLLMDGFSTVIEKTLRASGLPPASALLELLVRAGCVRPASFRPLALGPIEEMLVSSKGSQLCQFRVSLRSPAVISFVCDGANEGAAAFAEEQRRLHDLIKVLAPSRLRTEILHSATAEIESTAGEWTRHSLGLADVRSVLDESASDLDSKARSS